MEQYLPSELSQRLIEARTHGWALHSGGALQVDHRPILGSRQDRVGASAHVVQP